MGSFKHRLRNLLLGGLIALGAQANGQTPEPPETPEGRDERIAITLDANERALMLAGMRTYLESVHEIITALAANKTAPVHDAAKRSGAAMLQDVSPLTALKLPPGFVSMSFDTHDKFDRLAEKASKPTSRNELLRDLDAILANCTACHANFKFVAPR